MNRLSVRDRLHLFPVHRTLAAAIACTVAPVCLYVALENRDSSFVAVALGLGCLAFVAMLRPNKLFPFWKHGLDATALELHQQQVRDATIGSESTLNILTTLGLLLSTIGAILNIRHFI